MSAVRVAIAGSSGSVGTQTLDVVRAEAGAYEVVALGDLEPEAIVTPGIFVQRVVAATGGPVSRA